MRFWRVIALLILAAFLALEAFLRGFDAGQQRCLLPHIEEGPLRGD